LSLISILLEDFWVLVLLFYHKKNLQFKGSIPTRVRTPGQRLEGRFHKSLALPTAYFYGKEKYPNLNLWQ
jgi:hypothetical protein